MDRPYGTYSRTSTTARNAGTNGIRGARTGGYTDVESDVVDGGATYRRREYDPEYGSRGSYGSSSGYEYRSGYRSSEYGRSTASAVQDYDSYDRDADYGDYPEDYADDDDVYEYEESIDRRWVWVAGVAGAILLVAIICTVVILGGGDSGSVSKTIVATTPTTAAQDAVTTPATTAPPVLSSVAPPPPVAALSPETVTTVPPTTPVATSQAPAPQAAPVPVASPRTVTYQVTGDRPLLDLVTVVYTDGQGALQTQFNVALPWVRSVTLDPGVELTSVTATSLTGRLNCSVTDANGTILVAQNTNSMIATCTK
ncbi:hypothetical protein H7K45_16025 [Mycobacterium yunnanensis]|uniref:MmpS3 protein n=1 Tax=Mycobacterium yunnanensis TaxID=368477 RepID=A0A9X3BTV9_9MYCO|nr:hypothetical protein [Mycobacterium yunnanensis]MCV7422059.1 hypothetical protein [Mycobacterium yunnanensis]